MSKISVDEITDEAGTGAPDFPNGLPAARLTGTLPAIDGANITGVATAAQGTKANTALQPALAGVTSVDATTVAAFAAAGVGGSAIAAATGGTVTTDGNYKVHKFTSNGTFSITTAGPISFLIVSGGGAGGRGRSDVASGGGGAGGTFLGQFTATVTGNYNVVVGAGGIRDTGVTLTTNGSSSAIIGPELFNNTILGGGMGGGYSNTVGQSGASGGGGIGNGSTEDGKGGLGIHPFGNDGGHGGGIPSSQYSGSGGGGAGGAGVNAVTNSNNGRSGGAGVAHTITGSTVYYAGGGGGGAYGSSTGGAGGSGIGGTGGKQGVTAGNPTANSGSGGGGGGSPSYGLASNGAAGVVIFRYKFQ